MIFNKKNNINFIKVKLILPVGNVLTTPPVSTVLGQYRVDMNLFCKSFNENTKYLEKGTLIPIKISLKVGGILNYIIKTVSVSYLIKRLIIDLNFNKQKYISNLMYYKILVIKMQNNKLSNISIFKSILGTIKSMQLNKYHLLIN